MRWTNFGQWDLPSPHGTGPSRLVCFSRLCTLRSGTPVSAPLYLERDPSFHCLSWRQGRGHLCPLLWFRGTVFVAALSRAALPCLELCLRAPLPYSALPTCRRPSCVGYPSALPYTLRFLSGAPSPPVKREPEGELLASLFPLRAKRGGAGGARPT